MLALKYFISTIFIYLVLLFSSIYFYFDEIKNNIVVQENIKRDLIFDNFKVKIKDTILNNKYKESTKLLDDLVSLNTYKYVNLNYLSYYITNKSIIMHANKDLDMSWQLNDITTDVKQGSIFPFTNTIHIIKPNTGFNIDENILIIKSQAENQQDIVNIISRINFALPKYENSTIKDNGYFYNKFKKFIHIENNEKIVIFFIHNKEFANIVYKHSNKYIYNMIESKSKEYLIYFTIIFFIVVLIFLLINYFIMQNTTNRYLKKLKEYTSDILKNNFYRFDSKKLVFKDIKDVSEDITDISKKMATIINELNVNRNQLELKVSTDNLTGLPNNKIFEAEIKNLFYNKTQSYIIKIKLLCMTNYSHNNTIKNTNNLILSFVNKINSSISKEKQNSITVYRLYGSEFAIIIKNMSFDDINDYLNKLSNKLITIKDDYAINTKIAHMCSIPFDYYSSTTTMLNKLNTTFNKTVDIPKQISFYNEDNKKLSDKNNSLIKIVNSIVKNSAFTLSYKYNTYDYSTNKLVIQEVYPNLIDFQGKSIPIGSFVAVASDLKQAIAFDKDVIEKTFKFISNSQLEHKLAVNISIDSIKDNSFITWLESKLLYDYEDIKEKIIFIITSFAAKNNFEDFVNFTNVVNKFGSSIVLKRFNYNDLTFDQLDMVDITYIRVHSNYTDVLDKQNKNILRNISDFCVAKHIKLYADMVKSDDTHQALESLNFDGSSK